MLLQRSLITCPQEVFQLQQLQKLNLSSNQLTQLPKEISQLQQLRGLLLWYNQFTLFPKELLALNLEIKWCDSWSSNDRGINVAFNPFEMPPVEIVKQGRQAIIDYYDALEQKEAKKPRPLNELKLLLVGDGGAGKTSLMKRLLGQSFDRTESQTHGINLNTLDITVPALNNTTVKRHCWDFGGQQIMHATHQFFLTKRSLYILVLDARREAKVDYWLKHIQSVGDNAPVIIVINKIDENSHFDLPRNQLTQNYSNIKHFHLPDLLSPNAPDLTSLDTELQQANTLSLLLNYEFLPKAIFTRFLVKMHKYIDNQYYWKTGVLLRET